VAVWPRISRSTSSRAWNSPAYRPVDALTLALGYTYLDSENRSPGADTTVLQNRPEHKYSLTGDYDLASGTRLRLELLRATDSYALSRSTPTTALKLDSYTVANVVVSQSFRNDTLSVFARAQNLFDEDYAESFGFEQPGRTCISGLECERAAASQRLGKKSGSPLSWNDAMAACPSRDRSHVVPLARQFVLEMCGRRAGSSSTLPYWLNNSGSPSKQHLEILAVGEADPGAAVRQDVSAHAGRRVQGGAHAAAHFAIPAALGADAGVLPDAQLCTMRAAVIAPRYEGRLSPGDARESIGSGTRIADAGGIRGRTHDHVIVVHDVAPFQCKPSLTICSSPAVSWTSRPSASPLRAMQRPGPCPPRPP
jgi:hypothetical protein